MPSSSTSSFTPTPSLVSVNTIASSSSTTPLRPTSSSSSSSSSSPSSQPMQKDYSKSFGLLQSQYGWGPMTSIPTLVPSKKQDTEMREKRRKDRLNTRSRSVQEEQEADRRSAGKNYESVFGSLSSRYGFGGSWPTPSKKSKGHRS